MKKPTPHGEKATFTTSYHIWSFDMKMYTAWVSCGMDMHITWEVMYYGHAYSTGIMWYGNGYHMTGHVKWMCTALQVMWYG